MKAIILAAGKGERLQPFTYTKPKPLIPIVERPLLDYTLEALSKAGVEEAIIVGSYMLDELMKYLKSQRKVRWKIVVQKEPLGTGDALKYIEPYVNENFILIYGDILASYGMLKDMMSKLLRKRCDGLMLGVEVENPWDYGVLKIVDNNVKFIVEKPKIGSEPSNIVNGGVYILPREILSYVDSLKPSPRGEIELTDAINLMIRDGFKIGVHKVNSDEWFELSKPWDILLITKRILSGLKGKILGDVERGATVRGPVFIGKDARVLSGAYIEGPSYIGDNCTIGPNCYIRPYTVIGRDSRIGNAVEIKASVLMSNTHVGHLSYVGDSVLGEGVNFGAGTLTANLRFDDKPVPVTIRGERLSSGLRKLGAFVGDYVKTGINVSIMPGVKIGPYSWIAPGTVVYDDIPPNSIVKPSSKGYVVVRRHEEDS